MKRNPDVLVLTPPGFCDASLAIAASRAGGWGVLDLEFAHDTSAALAEIGRLQRFAKRIRGEDRRRQATSFWNDWSLTRLPDLLGCCWPAATMRNSKDVSSVCVRAGWRCCWRQSASSRPSTAIGSGSTDWC